MAMNLVLSVIYGDARTNNSQCEQRIKSINSECEAKKIIKFYRFLGRVGLESLKNEVKMTSKPRV